MKIIISREIRNEVKTEHNCENDDPYNTKIWRHPEFFSCLLETASKIAIDLKISPVEANYEIFPFSWTLIVNLFHPL